MSQRSRTNSVRLLVKEIAASNSSLPFIIIGDFNMKRTNPAVEFLLTDSEENKFPVTDAWLSVHPGQPAMPTCNFGLWGKGPQIDHIKLSENVKAITAEIDDRKVDGRYPSDHFPVIATIMFPKPPARTSQTLIAAHTARPAAEPKAAKPRSSVD